MSDTEYRTHFSLWTISKAPLIIGCDVSVISAASLTTLTNREVIAVNQDPLGIQGKPVAAAWSSSSNGSSEVIVANLSSSVNDPKRHQWIYNTQDGSIRSVHNGRCLSIARCFNFDAASIVLNDCRISDPHATCQGKNQQWTRNATNNTIVSQMNGKW
jgi:hypothetical protein